MYPFMEKRLTPALTCNHVMIDDEPILYVSHDEDGMWQFLCGRDDDTEDDALVLTMIQMYDRDKTVGKLADMPKGYIAIRDSEDEDWSIFEDYNIEKEQE